LLLFSVCSSEAIFIGEGGDEQVLELGGEDDVIKSDGLKDREGLVVHDHSCRDPWGHGEVPDVVSDHFQIAFLDDTGLISLRPGRDSHHLDHEREGRLRQRGPNRRRTRLFVARLGQDGLALAGARVRLGTEDALSLHSLGPSSALQGAGRPILDVLPLGLSRASRGSDDRVDFLSIRSRLLVFNVVQEDRGVGGNCDLPLQHCRSSDGSHQTLHQYNCVHPLLLLVQ